MMTMNSQGECCSSTRGCVWLQYGEFQPSHTSPENKAARGLLGIELLAAGPRLPWRRELAPIPGRCVVVCAARVPGGGPQLLLIHSPARRPGHSEPARWKWGLFIEQRSRHGKRSHAEGRWQPPALQSRAARCSSEGERLRDQRDVAGVLARVLDAPPPLLRVGDSTREAIRAFEACIGSTRRADGARR